MDGTKKSGECARRTGYHFPMATENIRLRTNKAFLLILLAALTARVLYITLVHPVRDSIFSDMKLYERVADGILAGTWEPSYFFQPIGFPLVIALFKTLGFEWTDSLQVLQLILSMGTIALAWRTSTFAFGEKIGILSAAAMALHWSLIAYVGLALTETTFTFLLAALAWLSLRVFRSSNLGSAAAWGFVFWLAFLFKGTHVFYGPLFLLALLWAQKTAALKKAAVISVVVIMGLIAHGALTSATIGKFQMSASAGGLNFVEGKCPAKRNSDSAGFTFISPLYFQLGKVSAKKWDRPFTDSGYFMAEGMACVAENPAVLLTSFESVPYLFFGNFLWPLSEMPRAEWSRLYELFFACFLVGGFLMYLRNRGGSLGDKLEELAVWVLPVAGLFLCVYIFKSEVRFRVPFDVWLIPLAIAGWSTRSSSSDIPRTRCLRNG